MTESLNPFRDPAAQPQWAALSRLGGDRAAILFEELRRMLAEIDGLQEELFYHGPETGWAPRYCVGSHILFSAHIGPGRLGVTMELDAAEREKLLASKRLGAGMKAAIQSPAPDRSVARVSVRLRSRSDVRALAKLIVLRHRLLASFEKRGIQKATRR